VVVKTVTVEQAVTVDPDQPAVPGWVRAFSELLEVGVIVVGQDQSLDFANSQAATLIGLDSPAELQRRWKSLGKRIMRDVVTNGAQGGPSEMLVTVAVDGRRHRLRCRVHRLDDDDCSGHLLLLSSRDRAEAIEASLRHATRDRALASLYRDLAHDLKGSLNALALNVDVMEHLTAHVDRSEASTREQALSALKQEIRRLDRMMAAVLGRDSVALVGRKSVEVRTLVESVAELIAARSQRQQVELQVSLPRRPADVRADAEQLHLALLTLVVNALDAQPSGGRLRLAVRGGASRVVVAVCDAGPGVPPEVLPHIWDLHFTTRTKGTGLGLAVARTIVRSHGGDLRYLRRRDGTTCFLMELPRVRD